MTHNNPSVLVIDDDPGDIVLLSRALDDMEGLRVTLREACNSQQALERLSQGGIDLVFVDFMLGAESGLDAIKKIKQAGYNCPIIMLTGQGCEELVVEVMKSGGADYLVKAHLTPDNLRIAISNALKQEALHRKIEEQRTALIDAERQRVMLESVGAACHHFSQPLTAMMGYLELLCNDSEQRSEKDRRKLEACLKASNQMADLLHRFQEVREYRTTPYMEDRDILDIGLKSIHGNSE